MLYIVFEKYLMWLLYSSNDLGWFACFRIQFLPDHIRRPRQTQGGARQGIRHCDYYYTTAATVDRNSSSSSSSSSSTTTTTTTTTRTRTTTTTMTLCRGTLLGPPPTGHVRRFIDSGVFVLPVGGPSRSLLEVRGAPWVALPALICSFEAASSRFYVSLYKQWYKNWSKPGKGSQNWQKVARLSFTAMVFGCGGVLAKDYF